MGNVLLDALASSDGPPTTALFGGEQALYDAAEQITRDSRFVEVAVALCSEWKQLTDRPAATALLLDAAASAPLVGVAPLFDVLLRSKDALPDIALGFERVLARRSEGAGFERDCALESWTRLALGNWSTRSLQLRAALHRSAEDAEVTAALVRALSAAVTKWPEPELLDALRQLTEHDEVESDAAMEMGFLSVLRAAELEKVEDVRTVLDEALGWFDKALLDDERPDASAFRAVTRGVLDQTVGVAIEADRFDEISANVYAYLDGYRGVDPGWRGPRPSAAHAWLQLLKHLREAHQDRWYDPPAMLQKLAAAMSTDHTMLLVVNDGIDPVGIRALVQPFVKELGRENHLATAHIRRWLASPSASAAPERGDVENLLRALEESEPKKAQGGSPSDVEANREAGYPATDFADSLMRAFERAPELRDLLRSALLPSFSLNIAEEELLEQLLGYIDIVVEGGTGKFRSELASLLASTIRFTAVRLNQTQSGTRRASWVAHEKPWPLEHKLADDLCDSLSMSGLTAEVEIPNTGGGRVDVAVSFERCNFYIEVKRTDQDRTDAQFIEDYGRQAVQYAATNVPVAFLAVADYVPRATRRDLTGVIGVRDLQIDETSRRHAVVHLRMQANVAPPSASSSSRI